MLRFYLSRVTNPMPNLSLLSFILYKEEALTVLLLLSSARKHNWDRCFPSRLTHRFRVPSIRGWMTMRFYSIAQLFPKLLRVEDLAAKSLRVNLNSFLGVLYACHALFLELSGPIFGVLNNPLLFLIYIICIDHESFRTWQLFSQRVTPLKWPLGSCPLIGIWSRRQRNDVPKEWITKLQGTLCISYSQQIS